ncbi:MAG: response regulator [Ignavibacteriae bacterium]|nr:response regulator [Ignavibacteriota bacterium]
MSNSIPRILLVEDNPNDVELTMAAFEANNLANEVFVVHDGELALDYLYRRGDYRLRTEGNPALILLDIKMPKVDGIEVLRIIKSDSALKSIPVVMLTSSREEQDLLETYSHGVNGYVVKPVDFQEFFDSVKQLGLFWAVINEAPPGSIGRE